MKLRINVLTLMFGLLGGLFSCSQEELADIPDNELKCDVSLVLSMGDIQTKAANDNYTYATTEELTIENCHVAVFAVDVDGKPTDRIHYQNFSNSTEMGNFTNNIVDKLSGYKLTLNNVRTFGKSKKVRVLIVANADNTQFEQWTTYNQYVSGTIETSEFSDSKLVKVGLSEPTDLTYESTTESTEIPISLNQLTARIEYEGVFDDDNKKDDSISLISISGINKKSQVAIFDTEQVENTAYSLLNISGSNTFYTYETTTSEKKITLSVKKDSKTTEFPLDATKFVKGNLYKIKGKYIPSVGFSINWEVTDMGRLSVTIPDFE